MANVQTANPVLPASPAPVLSSNDGKKLTGSVETASVVARESLDKQQVSNGSSELHGKFLTLSAVDEQLIAQLKADSTNVKKEGQKIFEDTLNALVRKMGGFLYLLTVQTKGFTAEKEKLSDPEISQKWALVCCESKQEASALSTLWGALKEIFSDRIKALRTAIEDSEFETAFLKEAIPGLNSYTTSTWAYYKPSEKYYGAKHILSETKASLDQRGRQIESQQTGKLAGGKSGESFETAEVAAAVPSSLNKCLTELAVEVTALKEVVYVLHAALQHTTSVENAQLPKFIYGSHKNSLKLHQDEIALIKTQQEERLAAIDNEIKEGGSSLSEKSREALVKEKAEISLRWENIQKDEKEIVRVLDLVKGLLKLTDEKIPVTGITFSPVYSKAINLLNLISSNRSNVVLGVGEGTNHEKDVQKYNRFEEEKIKFEAKDGPLEQHIKLLSNAAKTSQSFIDTFSLTMKELDKIFGSIKGEIKARSKWPEITVPISPLSSPTKEVVH